MSFEITSGKIEKAQKIVIYGPEGIGKSTFAAQFPSPLFIDTEGSTHNMDVKRLPRPSSWTMLKQEIDYIIAEKPCKTLVIDTIDWAEQLCIENLLSVHDKKGIEDFGYGNGYVYEKEDFARFLNKLEDVIAVGINVLLTAHAQMRKFSQPDEIGEYDRWELKLGKKTSSQISPLVKEWADLLLFANYKTLPVAVDKEGKKFKAQGSGRVMYTEHHACWDAKNRHGLPCELPFEYNKIAHIFTSETPNETAIKYWFDGVKRYTTTGEKPISENGRKVFEISKANYDKIVEAEKHLAAQQRAKAENEEVPFTMNETTKDSASDIQTDSNLPKSLTDLMASSKVTESEIRKVVSLRGYFPEDTPISNYPEDFINGVLIGAWEQVYNMIKQQRELSSLPQ